MSDLQMLSEVYRSLYDFEQVLQLASGQGLNRYTVVYQPAPHERPTLPKGKLAVYIFFYEGAYLKVGIAGVGNNSRYGIQPYQDITGINSSLLRSMRKDTEHHPRWKGFDPEKTDQWIEQNVSRINLLIDSEVLASRFYFALLETFLHCRLKPLFEGRRPKKKTLAGL